MHPTKSLIPENSSSKFLETIWKFKDWIQTHKICRPKPCSPRGCDPHRTFKGFVRVQSNGEMLL